MIRVLALLKHGVAKQILKEYSVIVVANVGILNQWSTAMRPVVGRSGTCYRAVILLTKTAVASKQFVGR